MYLLNIQTDFDIKNYVLYRNVTLGGSCGRVPAKDIIVNLKRDFRRDQSFGRARKKRFLKFHLKEGNLEGEEEEHLRYKCEINTISKYYTETPEIGQKLLTWNQDFKNYVLYRNVTLGGSCGRVPAKDIIVNLKRDFRRDQSFGRARKKRFLKFHLKEGNLEGEEEEHLRYKCEINTISKYYTETPEIGQKLLTWNQDFKVRFIQFIRGC
ncbi:hypothetical protein GLOIN_2v1849246 [Rhizophagus irregularis DAOM 181602=DAOM 197198]|uniref:Uncharacterized protein n=1 Tax=Rhizophagus irregularis (strain DAOM 181602 / DAOM 197198 / MUCL 43194) TaxID=747089 RepID=A0A2P4NS98_RHIID|nr:hypothetical protein GLOIN_2v1849246 [Rhizophagus irregularis DAOM 181602=DAOM 197198]POG56035.1 hypothetical protein GLOIN_2v1849246 [Rhizophagus irregularis DAOM 181602=DAOM 197198]|eukprot:XP_025164296.1 hypothetical protein GLOIN_2v1849246 [Rhizophagus irregularis DAOM 181602=DAOM 197198]